MKILTYNIWDHESGMPCRMQQVLNVLADQHADVCCLQEVSEAAAGRIVRTFLDMQHVYHSHAGLMLLTKGRVIERKQCAYGQCVKIETELGQTAVGNVHLPWDGAMKREKAIVEAVDMLESLGGDITLCAGDFNCSDQSSVHRYMKGEQSLLGKESCYFDLAESAAAIWQQELEPTLDFRSNSRWTHNTIECNQRFDRILLKNPYPNPFPSLEEWHVFGKAIDKRTGLCASDHYGVCAVLRKE